MPQQQGHHHNFVKNSDGFMRCTVCHQPNPPTEEKCVCGRPLDHEITDRLNAGVSSHYTPPIEEKGQIFPPDHEEPGRKTWDKSLRRPITSDMLTPNTLPTPPTEEEKVEVIQCSKHGEMLFANGVNMGGCPKCFPPTAQRWRETLKKEMGWLLVYDDNGKLENFIASLLSTATKEAKEEERQELISILSSAGAAQYKGLDDATLHWVIEQIRSLSTHNQDSA